VDWVQILYRSFSFKFVKLMQDAMMMSHYKYGLLRDESGEIVSPHILETDLVQEMRYRLKRFEETGRTEYLIDVANYAMIEFMKYKETYIAEDQEGRRVTL
jgi:hypothetical protein